HRRRTRRTGVHGVSRVGQRPVCKAHVRSAAEMDPPGSAMRTLVGFTPPFAAPANCPRVAHENLELARAGVRPGSDRLRNVRGRAGGRYRVQPGIRHIVRTDGRLSNLSSRPRRHTRYSAALTGAPKHQHHEAEIRRFDMQCEVCGNDYDKPLEIVVNGISHYFDSFECAIHALAPE